jgi:hypothetical protein
MLNCSLQAWWPFLALLAMLAVNLSLHRAFSPRSASARREEAMKKTREEIEQIGFLANWNVTLIKYSDKYILILPLHAWWPFLALLANLAVNLFSLRAPWRVGV